MKKLIFLFSFLCVHLAQAEGPKCAYLFEVTPVSLKEGPVEKRDHWDFHLAYLEIYERTGIPSEGLFNPIIVKQMIDQDPASPWVHHLLTLSDMIKKLDQPSAHDPELTNREFLKRDYQLLRMQRSNVYDRTIEPYSVPKTDSNERVTDQRILDILKRSGSPRYGLYDRVLLRMNLAQHIRESQDWPERAEALSAATKAIESIINDFNKTEETRIGLIRQFEALRTKLGL